MDLSTPDSRRSARPRRLRDRVLPVISLLIAALFTLAGWQVALRVREYNSNRAVGGLIVASLMAGKNHSATSGPAINQRTGLPILSFPPALTSPSDTTDGPQSGPADQADADWRPLSMSELTRASGYAEAVARAWERTVYGVAGVLGLGGLLGLFTRWVRGPHLVAAVLILLSTIGTLVAMTLLVNPTGGAFHPLPLQSYLLAAVAQAAYGCVLLVAFARKA